MIPTDSSLSERLIQELATELRDQATVLADLATCLLPYREPLMGALRAAEGGAPFSDEWYEQVVTVLIDSLRSRGPARSLQPYLIGVLAWGERAAATGMDYSEAVQQFTRLRRAALPYMLEQYHAGPELQLVLSALNLLERSIRTLIAAAYIEAGRARLLETGRMRTVAHLTRGIAHSLNNLLTNILGRAQLLERRLTDESARSELRAIQTAALTAADNLHRVQEFASAQGDDEESALDLNALANDAVQLTRYRWRDDAEANGVVIDVIKDLGDVPPVRGKRGALRDVLVELILNAAEAMPMGGIITLRSERVEDRVELSVTDTGEGMDATALAHAQTAFFTTKGAGHVGLGLATAAAALREQGGELRLTSRPGRGTSVTFTLPITTATPAAEKASAEAPTGSVSILVVDDEAAIREIASKSFALYGHRIVTAESGSEALVLFREQGPFEVVLTDLGMPGMNGLQVANAVKQLDPHTLVILMTGWGAELDARKVRESKVDQIINKPFDVDHVLRLIGQSLAE